MTVLFQYDILVTYIQSGLRQLCHVNGQLGCLPKGLKVGECLSFGQPRSSPKFLGILKVTVSDLG